MRSPRWLVSVLLPGLVAVSSLRAASLEVVGPLWLSDTSTVKLAQSGDTPVLYFQSSAANIQTISPGGTDTRVPVYSSALVDVREDNSQILCLHNPNTSTSGTSLPTALYLTSPAGGPWQQVSNPPGVSGRIQAQGFTPGGQMFGSVRNNPDVLWLRDPAGNFTMHTWSGAGSVTSVGAEGQVLVTDEQWWTAAQGAKPIPGGYKFDRISATSANGRWLVSFEIDSPQWWLNRLVRWSISESGELGAPAYQILPGDLEAASFARVLDNGTVFLTTNSSSQSAFRYMDAYVWHAHGALQRLADVLNQNEATRLPADWTVMGRIFDVSPDGRTIAGVREKPESQSVNAATEVWLASLDAPLPPPPATGDLRVRAAESTQSYTFYVANGGAAPLRLLSAQQAGPDAHLITTSNFNPALPLDLAPGAGVTFLVGVSNLQRDVQAEFHLTTDSTATPLHVENLTFESSQMPQIWLGKPSPQGSLFFGASQIKLAVGRAVPFQMTVTNSSQLAATNCQVEIQPPAGLILTPSAFPPFDLPAQGSQTLDFTITAAQAGEFTPRFTMQPKSGFRVNPHSGQTLLAISPHELHWVSPDGETEYDPETKVLDFGDIPVGGLGQQDIRLAYAPNGSQMTVSVYNSLTADVHAYTRRELSQHVVPTMESWNNVISASSPGKLTQRVVMTPKTSGVQETVVRFDAPGAAAPVNLRVRCTGVAQAAVFLTQPQSAILLLQEAVTVQARAVGLASVVDTLKGSLLQVSAPDEYSFVPEPGLRQLRLTYTNGTLLSQEFRTGRIDAPRNLRSEQQSFKPGGSIFLSAPQHSEGMRYEWLKDGEVLAASSRVQFNAKTRSVTLKKLQPSDAGEYACRYILDTPGGEITRTLIIATLVQEAAIIPPAVTPFTLRTAREGEFLQFYFSSVHAAEKFTVSGLPPGLKYKDGLVTGFISLSAAAKVPKTYRVRVRASYKGVTGPEYQTSWVIEPFADAWLAGTYHGIIERGGAYPQGAAVKVVLNASGAGSFSISGPLTPADGGAILLGGRGPSDLPTEFDPPLPQGLGAPTSIPALVGVGKVRRGVDPLVLALGAGDENILAGTLGSAQNLVGVPVVAFRQIAPSRELQPKGAAPFSVHLKVPEAQWSWKKQPDWPVQPGPHGQTLTFTDGAGRLHLLGSHLYTSAPDHWVWDVEALKWVTAEAAGLIAPTSPKLDVKAGQISWQAAGGGDFWTLTPRGGLWKWAADGNSWQIVQEDLPAGASGSWGEIGVPSAANRPRGRTSATTWVTADGDLWMFGGSSLSDLWRYQPQTGLWTWMAGRVALPSEQADWRSDGILDPSAGAGPGWVGNDGRLYLHQGLQAEDRLWAFDPTDSTWTREYTSTGTRVQPGLANWSDRVMDAPETGTSPGQRSPRSLTWTGADGQLYLFGGATRSYGPGIFDSFDFYIWHYDPETHHWVCDGNSADGLDTGGFGFTTAQTWPLPDGRLFLRGARRFDYLNQSDPDAGRLFEFGPHPVQGLPGFLSLQIAANGTVKWTGRLPDNEVVTGSGGLSKVSENALSAPGLEGAWISGFYSVLGRKTHTAQGLLVFAENTQECTALLDWNRPEAASVTAQRILPGGFPVTALAGTGWRHNPLTWKENLPAGAISLAPFLDLPANKLTFGLDSRQRFTATLGSSWTPDKFKVAYAPATGLVTLSGTIPDPSDPKTIRPWNLQGLLIPHDQSAAGLFTLPAPLDATLVPIPVKQAPSTQIHVGGFDALPSR